MFGRAPAGTTTPEVLEPRIVTMRGDRAVFVNGRFAPEHSLLDGLPEGVRFGSIAGAFDTDGALLEAHLGAYTAASNHAFEALNTAFLADGAFVYVPEGVALTVPLHIVFATIPGAEPVVTYPRVLVVAERGAKVVVGESYVGIGDGTYWSNATTEVVLGDEAKVDLYRMQREGEQAYHTAVTRSHQGRDSVFKLATFGFGAQLSRHDIVAVLDGEGADCTLDGLSLMRADQHTDAHTTLEHAKPNCTSWEYFNGIFDERAHGVFTGRIIVRPGAQKTDAKQTNNNLLLSESARADSQPQLEIYADDVKCTHGATLGPMDDDQVFYLQARGMSRDAARAMLTYGFASEILSAVTEPALRHQLDALVRERLGGQVMAQMEG
jgi:Fe-S cluster assembly protein SufD